MANMQGKAQPDLLFKVETKGLDIYVTTKGLSYVFSKKTNLSKGHQPLNPKKFTPDSTLIKYCRADMNLVGANIQAENISKEGESEDKTDYYLGGICPDGVLNVHSYKSITIKNIYKGVDWVLVAGQKGLKYNFIVHAGAKPSDIKLCYQWANKPVLQHDGSLKTTAPMGSITEGAPVSYCGQAEIKTSYQLHDNEISFSLGNYDNTQTLTIDPTLVWASLTGGSQNGINYPSSSICCDSNNIWVCGTAGIVNFPAFNPGGGAYFQDSIISKTQAALIMKFTKNGVLQWSTYYGGDWATDACSISSDNKSVWITGSTTCNDLPTLNPGGGAYFQSAIGNSRVQNAFILQFSTAGVRKWATYYGGIFTDEGESIKSDGIHVWITGSTSSNNFPTYDPGGGAYYQPPGTNIKSQIFILEFNTVGVLDWGTCYSGSSNDYGTSISSDGTNIWVTGLTSSSDLPLLNPGGGSYYQNTLNGGTDNAFILQFNTNGARKWATYYGGNSLDEGNCVYSDGTNVWLTGTTSSSNFPTFNPGNGAYFQTYYNAYLSSFILQFTTAGVRKWATFYSGTFKPGLGGDEGLSIFSDKKNVWVTGGTASTSFPTLPANDSTSYYRGANAGYLDAFILGFTNTGVCKWATYYGGDTTDFGSGICSDGVSVWVCGYTASKNFPTLNPGGGAYYQDTLKVPYNSGFILQFSKCLLPPFVGPVRNTSICIGDSMQLHASGATSYSWAPTTGLNSTSSATTTAMPIDTINYIVYMNNGICYTSDTATINVVYKPIANIIDRQDICSGNTVSLWATGGGTYSWSPATGLNITDSSRVTTAPIVNTTYTVAISNGVCMVDTSVSVIVNSTPTLNVCCDTTILNGQPATPIATGGYAYIWMPASGLNCSTCPNPIASPTVTTNYTVMALSDSGCTVISHVNIEVLCGDIFIPEAFSPNDDGQNDVLYVRGPCIKTLDFMVFDRWGNKVFETNDKTQGWNGQYKGETMNSESYAYYMTATMFDGSTITRKGNVALIR